MEAVQKCQLLFLYKLLGKNAASLNCLAFSVEFFLLFFLLDLPAKTQPKTRSSNSQYGKTDMISLQIEEI